VWLRFRRPVWFFLVLLAERRNQALAVGWRGEQTIVTYEGRLSSDGKGCSFSLSNIKSVSKLYKDLSNKNLPPSSMDDGGGHQENHDKNYREKRTPVEHLATSKVGKQVENHEYLVESKNVECKQIVPRIVDPVTCDSIEVLLEKIGFWWTASRGNKIETWKGYSRLLRRMANHNIFPVNLFDPNPDQINAYLDFLRQQYAKERTPDNPRYGKCARINNIKAIRAVMQSYGRLSETLDWNLPRVKRPDPKPKKIPPPNIVYKFMHGNFSKDRYENALYQYMYTLGFMIGPRPSSEMPLWKVDDFDEGCGFFTFWQPKVERYREVELETELWNNLRRKSLKNWIDHWRPKVQNSKSGDYLFLQPSGKPFTKHYFRKQMNHYGKPIWEPYSPYSMRHFCATARLIGYKVRTGVYATKEVCDYMDHSSIAVTEGYVRTAKKWYRREPYDWIQALLKFHKNMERQKGKKSIKGRFTSVSSGTNGSNKVRICRGLHPFSPVVLIDKIQFLALFDQNSSTFLFLFFFIFGGVIKRISSIICNWQSGVEERSEGMDMT